jgi:hypothetical protein
MALTLNGTTGISGIAGSAGTPALQGNNDANTGYFFAADTLGLSTAGTSRLYIISDGKVGIGTTSPTQKLDVAGSLQLGNGNAIGFGDQSARIIGESGASGILRFDVNGGERLRITSAGVLSLNDSTPETWATLQINNQSTHNAAQVLIRGADQAQIILRDDTGGTDQKCTTIRNDQGDLIFGQHNDAFSAFTESLRIKSAGRLLLGTTVDSLFNGGRNASFQQEGTTAATSAFAITRNSNDANPAYISFGKSRGTSTGANTAVQNGDVIGTIEFNAGDGSGSFNCHALIKGSVDAAPGNNDAPGRLSFWTTPDGGSTTPLERLCITSDGKTVIGHTAVSGWQNSTQLQLLTDSSVGGITTCRYNNDYGGYGLTIARSKTSTIGAHGQVTSGQNIGHIQFVGSDGSAFRALGDITCAADGNVTSTSAEGKIIFKTSKSSSVTPTQAMTIKANHNVEIHDGNIVFETSGNGIDFSATSGTGTSELLDDYEHGNWVPTSVQGGWTVSSNYSKYVKIGNLVHLQMYISLSGTGNSNDLQFGAMPFAVGGNGYSVGTVDFGEGGIKGTYMRTMSGASTLSFLYPSENTSNARLNLAANQVGDSYVIATISYVIDGT